MLPTKPRIAAELELSKQVLKSNINVLDTEITVLERQLKNTHAEHDSSHFGEKIKEQNKKELSNTIKGLRIQPVFSIDRILKSPIEVHFSLPSRATTN
jgi:hypothetical protein